MNGLNSERELIEQANKLKEEKKYEEALQLLEPLYNLKSKSDLVKQIFIETLFECGAFLNDDYEMEYEKASKIFLKATEIDPNNYRAHYYLGLAYFNLKNFNAAKTEYEKAIRLKPRDKFCFYNLGLLYEAERNYQEAKANYEKALEIDPKFGYAVQAYSNMIQAIEAMSCEAPPKRLIPEKLKSLFKVSTCVRIDTIQDLLGIKKSKLLDILIAWCERFQFEIDGDFLKIKKEKLSEFFKEYSNFEK